MSANLKKQAINAAICGDWKKAIKVNRLLIKENPNSIDTLNRLAFALLQTQQPTKAIKICKSVLKIDPNNPIAERNIAKARDQLTNEQKTPYKKQNKNNIYSKPEIFIIEPGKTLNASLINLAPQSTLNYLCISQKVDLIPKKKAVEIREETGLYIGSLPDDLSFRLRNSIKQGNNYSAYIKSVSLKKVTILIREA